MKFRLTAAALLLAAAPASAAKEIRWTGVGWYVLSYGEITDDVTGWLALNAGPYSAETACKSEAERLNNTEEDFTILYSCRHMIKSPRPNKAGGIMIWVENGQSIGA